MTIVEAIKNVLSCNSNGLTSEEIYRQIVERNLYTFGAKKPVAVVNGEIRRRCKGLDFPTAFPIKMFEIVSYAGKKPLFCLLRDTKVDGIDDNVPMVTPIAEQLPEERITEALIEYYSSLKQQVMDRIMTNSPSFFEHIVMDLLLRMGYGCDSAAGRVTGRSHDGGVDGIISEDKLGLDLIYIQAKRYAATNKVGRKELQAFVGAMENVQKGVFITTSSFTREAAEFVEKQQQKSIRLIDGKFLAELLVKYAVGISAVQSFSIYRIDTDYYGEV